MIMNVTKSPRAVTVPCTLDIEQTTTSLHAHVVLEGIEVEPGDVVTVHDAPGHVVFGARVWCKRSATVVRANRFQRMWVRITSNFILAELFEVGFLPRRH